MNPPPDPLDQYLDGWKAKTPEPPADIKSIVWRQIAAAESRREQGFWARLHEIFARPSFATAFVAACVLLGLFLAEVRRSHHQAEYNRELMQSYLRLIDPLLDAADKAAVERGGLARS
jgi:hypothetical protein